MQWMGDKIRLSAEHAGACFASISTPLVFTDYTSPPVLPSALLAAFKTCTVDPPDTVELLKVMFATQQFENAPSLAESLFTFCSALEELHRPLLARSGASPRPPCSLHSSLHWLEMIVSLSQKHMKEFYSAGAISDDEEDSQHVAMDSLHMSSMSESTRASMRGKHAATSSTDEDSSQQRSLQKQSLEEFSLILALKDLVLCSMEPGSKRLAISVRLIGDLFPNCDIDGLLAHEMSVREGMAAKAQLNREAVESARESRAASVMQMMREENYPNPGMQKFV